MRELPSDLPKGLENRIHAALMHVHSERLEGLALAFSVKKAYDACAEILVSNGADLPDELLSERLPQWVLHWAFAKEWTPYPPVRQIGEAKFPFLTDRPHLLGLPSDIIYETELNEEFGELKITPAIKADFLKGLSSRIAYWQAVVMKRPGANPVPEVRRGYRVEVRQWMKDEGLATNAAAARRLGLSTSGLKSIMSSKGEKRYGDETLTRVLKDIGFKEQ